MTHLSPDLIDLAITPADCPMFSELMERIQSDTSLNPTRARDFASGLRRVAKALGRAPADVPCSPRWLQPRLSKVSPQSVGLSPKSWANAVSDARAAMAHVGIVERRIRSINDLSPAWQHLWRAVLDSDDPTLPAALCRFVHFLSRTGVAPEDVRATHAIDYRSFVEVHEISKDPDTATRAAVNGWNLATRRVPGWPSITIVQASRQKIVRLPDGTMEASFHKDLEAWLDGLLHPDPLAGDGPRRPLRPASVKHYRHLILRFVAHAVAAGADVTRITDLGALCDLKVVEGGLRRMLDENNRSSSRSISQTGSVLRLVARDRHLDTAASDRISQMARRVAVPAQRAMTAKNRERLLVLQDDKTLLGLLDLPERIFQRAGGKKITPWQGSARETALAISILLYCPVRVGNLASIHLDQHLQRPGSGRVFLVFYEEAVKNARPVEFEVPPPVVRILDRHLATRAPHLCPAGTPWLFPRRDGTGPVEGSTLTTRIKTLIRKELGIDMHSHLFRHLAVMVLLDAHPGSYEAAKRLLAHSALAPATHPAEAGVQG
jgi:integrase